MIKKIEMITKHFSNRMNSDAFYARKKHKNANKRLSLRCFYTHKKNKKHKNHEKTQKFKQVIFFFLDVFMRIKILSFLCT